MRIDLAARSAAGLKSNRDLTGFTSLAWRAGVLIGVQRTADSYLVVRLKLDAAGTRTQSRQVLASSPESTVGTLSADSFYYLSADTIHRLSAR